jgi:hypothetical protein
MLHSGVSGHGGSTLVNGVNNFLLSYIAVYGTIIYEDDYYNGAILYIYGGTGAGQVRRIIDSGNSPYYNNHVALVPSPDFDIVPDSTSIYCILPDIAQENEDVLVSGTIMEVIDPTSPIYAVRQNDHNINMQSYIARIMAENRGLANTGTGDNPEDRISPLCQ